MTPANAITLARQAGMADTFTLPTWWQGSEPQLLAFANLIEARVREECAKIVETIPEQVIEFWERPGGPPGNGTRPLKRSDIAAAIRSTDADHVVGVGK